MATLSFYDHARQSYADVVPGEEAGEIMVGDYGEDPGVGELGEFKIVFHRFGTARMLAPQVQAFGDAVQALGLFLALGGGKVMTSDVTKVDDFSRRLIDLGLADRSEKSLAEAA